MDAPAMHWMAWQAAEIVPMGRGDLNSYTG